ncbi:flagellar protein [Agrobacterium larrymoorei]|uniref:flagellar protein n=1 Tax=Agrobacterium larrymoorei TaxID=160699 RepID=UPI0004B51731|nr:flagellar protein [Agrobacterium larrymoorei]
MIRIKKKIKNAASGGQENARRSRELDRFLTGGLLFVAAAAAGLPWYVFLNPDKFGISGNGWEALKHVPQRGGGGVETIVPHYDEGIAGNGKAAVPDVQIDNVVTATVPANGKGNNNADETSVQPFPDGTRFKLLHVSNGRALIEDKSGMFLVQIGSILPDESRLLSLSNVQGKWQIVTSAGEVYSE